MTDVRTAVLTAVDAAGSVQLTRACRSARCRARAGCRRPQIARSAGSDQVGDLREAGTDPLRGGREVRAGWVAGVSGLEIGCELSATAAGHRQQARGRCEGWLRCGHEKQMGFPG